MFSWLHHILEPHCQQCREERQEERQEDSVCASCETLRLQLEIANYEKRQLLESILRPQQSVPSAIQGTPQALQPKSIPWSVRKQMLESEDRKQAQLMREAQEQSNKLATSIPRGTGGDLSVSIKESQSIESLERELGVDDV